jgi:hypothetical protein
MLRAWALGLIVLAAAGCQLSPERMPLRLLPEDSPPFPYAELLTRARLQSTAATDAFQVNNWADVEEAARGLEQTARFLSKATDVPAKFKDTLPVLSGDLGKEAVKLRDVAREKDVKQTTEALQRVQLKVRELRLEN